jgi:hypothetical protein
MAIGMLAPAKDENPMNQTTRGKAGVKVSMQSTMISRCWVFVFGGHTRPIFNDPKEEVTQESSQLAVQFETGRPTHQPRYAPLQCFDCVRPKQSADLESHPVGVLDDIRTNCDADNDIVGD